MSDQERWVIGRIEHYRALYAHELVSMFQTMLRLLRLEVKGFDE